MILLLGCTELPVEVRERPFPEIPAAIDTDPSADRVEVHLEAVVTELPVGEGPPSEAWAYRDLSADGPPRVPGPRIDVAEGQALEVHLHNALDRSTTLHLHGVALPNDMDGSEVTQMLVRPGEEHHHDFVVTHPGTFWYHPHFEVADQMARGLYGPGVSTGDDDLAETADRTIVLVDALVDADGKLVPEVDPEVWRTGRQGTVVLVNGAPAGEDLVLHATARERWRILDAAHSRYFELALEGHELHVVGGDAGQVRTPWTTDRLRIAPGERYEVIVEPRPDTRAVLWSEPADRGFDLPEEDPVPLFTVVGPARAAALPALPATRDGMPPVGVPADTRDLVLSEGTAPNGEPLFFVDGVSWPFSPPIEVPLGGAETWTIHNCTAGNQPFHLHGLFFDVLDTDGVPPVHDSREDVADLPPFGTLTIAVPFEVEGDWMFHTHLLDPASHGMMSVLTVSEGAVRTASGPPGCP